jgi:hypothetical protein
MPLIDGEDTMKGIHYGNVIGLLVEAIKELQDKVKILEAS